MNAESQSKEQRILVAMRKVLARIVRDTTPSPGMRHPLSDGTIQDIRECFALISARERELAEAAGIQIKERPRYADEPSDTKVVSIKKIGKPKPPQSDEE